MDQLIAAAHDMRKRLESLISYSESHDVTTDNERKLRAKLPHLRQLLHELREHLSEKA